ncbi:hypothetical protein E4634_11190 [Mangrovimicrobium sediminis]|uniref:PasA protein n=1 Tax=Mangrovimicrobium sediminis TaxID=2562682 RepID=A0A4Z0M1V0_9GAMM|nr:DUF6586 family protein [Haliea sp. SAOS-164]TGD73582.1 hypothetical protein E4634_11190 [Haliea sp. SAOS-164]
MSSARARANHHLYLARTLLRGWQREADEEAVPGSILSQAYLPAVREHLVLAYGWFLLEITRPEPMPAQPPRCVAQLPALPQGKSLPGEAREFEQLEQGGWLAELLDTDAATTASRTPGNLASTPAFTTARDAGAWADALQKVFDRMGDALDEY